MKLAVLFSGGKDSSYALYKASKKNRIVCLLSIISENSESYMFHVPNISLTKLQAEAMGLPRLTKITKGEKEKELVDLKLLIEEAKKKYRIEGIVTGAVESVYQATRIQKICDDLGLWCFNPLWQKDQVELLKELVNKNFKVKITGIFGYPLNEKWLGKDLNDKVINELVKLSDKYDINPAGEGGEIETTVIDSPMFNKKLLIEESEIHYSNHSGYLEIKKARLV